MRPDRLVVGEVRGGEVVELLAALNTGHEGGCGTLHANSAGDVPARVEALALAAGLGRDADAQPARLGRRRGAPPRAARRRQSRLLREVAVPVREPRRAGRDADRRSSSPTTASHRTGPGADALAARLGRMTVLAVAGRRAGGGAVPRATGRAPRLGRDPARGGRRWWRAALVIASSCSGCPGAAVLVVLAAGVGAGGAAPGRAVGPATAPRSRPPARVLETCELLAAELAAGQPPGRALEPRRRAWPPLRPVAEAFDLGGDVPAALRAVGLDAPGAGDLRLLAAVLGGGPPDRRRPGRRRPRCADSIRAAHASRRLVEGELASARATVRLVAGLPVLALLMGSGAGGDPVGFLLGHPIGLACLAGPAWRSGSPACGGSRRSPATWTPP